MQRPKFLSPALKAAGLNRGRGLVGLGWISKCAKFQVPGLILSHSFGLLKVEILLSKKWLSPECSHLKYMGDRFWPHINRVHLFQLCAKVSGREISCEEEKSKVEAGLVQCWAILCVAGHL